MCGHARGTRAALLAATGRERGADTENLPGRMSPNRCGGGTEEFGATSGAASAYLSRFFDPALTRNDDTCILTVPETFEAARYNAERLRFTLNYPLSLGIVPRVDGFIRPAARRPKRGRRSMRRSSHWPGRLTTRT